MNVSDRHRTLLELKRILQYHRAMGIAEYPRNEDVERFLTRKVPSSAAIPEKDIRQRTTPSNRSAAPRTDGDEAALMALTAEINSCTLCPLSEKKAGTVAGRGSSGVRLMVVGDWSDQEEPCNSEILFGGDEDAMLWKMMAAIDLAAEQVYVTNCLKCCPQKGTEPEGAEIAARCFPHLEREIAAVRPVLICAMGEMAAKILLGKKAPLFRLRGRMGSYRYQTLQTIAVMPTFHPRFLLANPEMKKATWHDLQQVKRYLEEKSG